jgi:hypothetical protein
MAVATGGGRADGGDAVGRNGRTEALASGGLVALDRGLDLSGVGETGEGGGGIEAADGGMCVRV